MVEGNQKVGTIELARYSLKNMNYFKAIKARDGLRIPLYLANMEIGKMDPTDPIYSQRVEELNQAAIELYKGKWYSTLGSRKRSKEHWKKAFQAFKNGKRIAEDLLKQLRTSSKMPVEFKKSEIESKGTEITYADDVPLVPEITPVLVLQGSDYEMGFQYAQQLIQIFGPWILKQRAGREFTDKQRRELSRWEKEHRKHTPWVIEFARGWAHGATESGIPMSYEDVLYLWVGDKPPAKDFLSQEGLPEIPNMACSGVAAWGRATSDGKLVTGTTGDHDLSYQVIIMAYPDDGNAFIYSAFGATGAIAAGGEMWFFGHPAMNSKGLAYVEHGGGPKFLEPKKYWGYGVRRAASVIHIMRYADTAKEAKEIEMSMPIGDIGNGDQATVGGFYADDTYGYIIESRKEPLAIRESGLMGETDFLYANNSVTHPKAIESEWMSSDIDEWIWDPHGGWRPIKDVGMTKSIGLFLQWASGRLSTSDMMKKGMMFSYTNSSKRNNYLFDMMDQARGKVDVEYLKMVYRNGGTIPEGDFIKIAKEYNKTGKWGRVSSAHGSNALTAVLKPGEGLFSLCTGPAKRGMAPMMPSSVLTIYNETNAFYELKLQADPEQVVEYARTKADEYIREATLVLEENRFNQNAHTMLKGFLDAARHEYSKGEELFNDENREIHIHEISEALRCYTRAQVKAKQVINAVSLPPSNPDEYLASQEHAARVGRGGETLIPKHFQNQHIT